MKKLAKFGCLGLVDFFLLLLIIGSFAENTTEEDLPRATYNPSATYNSEFIEEKEDSLMAIERRKEDSINAAEKALAIEELKTFRKNSDDFNDMTFYRDKRAPVYNNRNFIFPYIGEKNGYYWMKIRYQYAADDWLFIEQVRIKTDSSNYSIFADFERDNNSEIWEWHDQTVNEKELAMLEDIADSKEAKVRYVGSQYRDDRVLTWKEKDIIKKTLEIYKALN